MSLLSELSAIAKRLKIPAQTAVYSGNAPEEYLVFTPLYDSFELRRQCADCRCAGSADFTFHKRKLHSRCKQAGESSA